MTVAPHSAMILAAGLGMRMRPLTDATAKPLLTLGGRTLLDHALDHLVSADVETVAVNVHWQADAVAKHLLRRPVPPRTVLLREADLLETGGGVRAALAVLGADPFFVVNGDSFWLNGPISALRRLAAAFDDSVDGVLLVHRTSHWRPGVCAPWCMTAYGSICRRRTTSQKRNRYWRPA